MCNVRQIVSDGIGLMSGKTLSQVFPQDFMRRRQLESVMQGHCLTCNRPLSHHEMFPANRATPRAMCPQCYDNWTRGYTNVCPIDGLPLDSWKIENQRSNPREVQHRLHDGLCLLYFSLLSCKVLGDDLSFIYPERSSQWIPFGNDIIDMGAESQNQFHNQPARALEYQPLEPINRYTGNTHKGKKVKIV